MHEVMLWQADVATVLRESRLSLVPAGDLVPGDIVEVAGSVQTRMHPIKCLPCMHSLLPAAILHPMRRESACSRHVGVACLTLSKPLLIIERVSRNFL